MQITVTVSFIIFSLFVIAAVVREYMWWDATRKTRVTPIYKRPEFKLYEIGALIDREIHDRDFVATLVNNILNPDVVRDKVEQDIYIRYGNKTTLTRLINHITNSKTKDLKDNSLKTIYIRMVNLALVKSGYYYFDPKQLQRYCIFGLSLMMLIVFIASNGTLQYSVAPFQLAEYEFLILPFSIFGSLALFAHSFHMNIGKVAAAREVLLGYRMFLYRTEYYTVQKDIEKYEDILPLFLALGVHTKAWEVILKYTHDKI